jgi:hypothetical protein
VCPIPRQLAGHFSFILCNRRSICGLLVSNIPEDEGMRQETQFRKVLPVVQTTLAVFFGGWGLWLRNSILSQPFFGSTLWTSTARFHVWPWPIKFATILNLPVMFAGLLLSWPLDYLRPGLPEWVSSLPVLLLIPLFWHWLGSWADKHFNSGSTEDHERWLWALLLFFIFVCAAASSISGYVGGHASYLEFGIGIWLGIALSSMVAGALRRLKSKVALPPPSPD